MRYINSHYMKLSRFNTVNCCDKTDIYSSHACVARVEITGMRRYDRLFDDDG